MKHLFRTVPSHFKEGVRVIWIFPTLIASPFSHGCVHEVMTYNINAHWSMVFEKFSETLLLGFNTMCLTSTCLHPQCRTLVVLNVLQLLEQTQSFLQGDGKHEVQTHSGVLGPITHHKEEREFKRFRELSSLHGSHMWQNVCLQRGINEFLPNGSLAPVSKQNYIHSGNAPINVSPMQT